MSSSKPPCNNQPHKADVAQENEILKIAVAHVDLRVFVYNRSSGVLQFVDDKTPPIGLPRHVTDPICYIEQQGLMEPEDVQALYELLERNLTGIEKTSTTIKSRPNKDEPDSHWYNVVLTNCFDTSGNVVHLVGTIQDVTSRVLSELRYSKEEQFRMAMMADSRRVYEVNVTRDRFMRLESISDSTDINVWHPYSQTMMDLCKAKVFKEDWDCFLQVATRKNLLEAFAQGQNEFYCEYRIVDNTGELSWSASTTHLLHDPISGEVKGFIYATDIDAQKKQEILLRQQAERDPLTGVYNRAAAERLIEEILCASRPKQLHGFLSIDIDDFKTVNDTFGHLQGDQLLQQMADGFSSILRENDILARMGGDEFIVFLPEITSLPRINAAARRLCNFVHTLHLGEVDEIRFSISVGIAACPINGATFAELYKYSDAALYHAKQHGKNCVSAEF